MPDTRNVIFDGGELVLASEDERIVEGRLLPFNTIGHTNVGAFTVEAGVLELPADPEVIGLNIEHDREQPVGRAIAVESREDGVYARYRIARTPEGDQALADVKSGKRKSLSMEAKGVIVRAGKAISGRLFGAALVERPAFAGATVIAALHEDGTVEAAEPAPTDPAAPVDASPAELTPDENGNVTVAATETPETVTVAAAGTETVFVPNTDTEENPVAEAKAPETVVAASAAGSDKKKFGYRDAFRVMAARHNGTLEKGADFDNMLASEATVFAAQQNVTFPVGDSNPNPQWVGEFWGDIDPIPLVSDLLTPKPLTSRQVQGFRPVQKPIGGEWAGNGAEIASGPITFAPETFTARNWAGGNNVSRENTDFGLAESFFEWYFGHQAINFQQWLDGIVLDGILADLTPIDADTVPSNIDAGTSALVDGIVQYVETRHVLPTFALMSSSAYKTMLKAPQTAVLGYLAAALGVSEGEVASIKIRPVPEDSLVSNDSGADAYKVVVGNKNAGSVYTLPGSPIRAQALDVPHGLIQVGLYGYGLYVPDAAEDFIGVV